MRRKSKIESALNSLFRTPPSNGEVEESDVHAASSETAECTDSTALPDAHLAETQFIADLARKKTHSSAPLLVDAPRSTLRVNLDEIPISPPFETETSIEPTASHVEPVGQPGHVSHSDALENWYGKQIVVFSLNGQPYAIRIDLVESIIKMQLITALPVSHPCIAGIINLRGAVLPVINLNRVLGLEEKAAGSEAHNGKRHILIVMNNSARVGLIVDQVTSVVSLAESEYESLPSASGENPFFTGVARHHNNLILLLNLRQVLSQVF